MDIGKFGEVYKAQMQTITVAVKVTKEYSSEKAMRDFQNEMSIMSEVAHHNIVRLYGIISEGELHSKGYLPHNLSKNSGINWQALCLPLW